MSTPILSIKGLKKSFGPNEILKGIDLNVTRRELLVIIGPSGSGKSTLIRCCNRLEKPSAGQIIFQGIDIASPTVDINSVRRKIGMVFQSFNLYPHLNALRNVTLALRKTLKLNPREADTRGQAMLAQVGLEHKAKEFPDQLSGGEQQRVAIARTLALEPEILLLDEPTSALDPELVESVLHVIRKLRDDGMTMIVVSHQMAFVKEAADRVVFLKSGNIVEKGSPKQIFESPKQPDTKKFLEKVSR